MTKILQAILIVLVFLLGILLGFAAGIAVRDALSMKGPAIPCFFSTGALAGIYSLYKNQQL